MVDCHRWARFWSEGVGASKSRQSPSVIADRAQYGSRPIQTRRTIPIITIVCDDGRTAVSYFGKLKRMLKDKLTLVVVPKPHAYASALEVVAEAQRQLAELKEERWHDDTDENSV